MVAVRDRQRRRPKRHLRLRRLAQDAYRRSSVTGIANSVNGIDVETFSYAYDALGRPTIRNADTFSYNDRSEVTSATIGGNYETHEYDSIGNSIIASFNGTTKAYSANNLYRFTGENNSWVVEGATARNANLPAVQFANATPETFKGLKVLSVTFDAQPTRKAYYLTGAVTGLTAADISGVAYTVTDETGNDYTENLALTVQDGRLTFTNGKPKGMFLIVR